jgi:CheY-like chemotaxis protein
MAAPAVLLIADDSATIRRVVELTFADEDITVVSVGDGDQAIARIEADPPDIVLADTGMPGRSGYEVAAYVRQSPRLAHIPVVLLTGAFERVDEVRAGEACCDGVLAKPFEPQVVVARVKELLSRPRSTALRAVEDRTVAGSALAARSVADPAAVDRYFDRLHAAFAGPQGAPLGGLPPGEEEKAASPPAAGKDAIDLFRPKEPEMTNPTPPLADAFAALLAAEQREPLAALPSSWPAGAAASSAVVDEATRRVLDQLSDKVVRETVTKVVSQVAERLVKEEIERIKGSIK